jgi:hypothetical protein
MECALTTRFARIARAYADQGPGPTLTVLMALIAAIGQAELTLAPPQGPAAAVVVVQAAQTPAAVARPASADSSAMPATP